MLEAIKKWYLRTCRGTPEFPPFQGDELLNVSETDQDNPDSYPESVDYYLSVYRCASVEADKWNELRMQESHVHKKQLKGAMCAHYSSIRIISVSALCTKSDVATMPLILELQEHRDPDCREDAATLLDALPDDAVVFDRLKDKIQQEPDDVVRLTLIETMIRRYGMSQKDDIRDLLDSERDEEVRDESRKLLSEISNA